jgi:hypothetical protein
VRFRITHHSGFAAPADALDLLCERLGPRREDIWFTKVGDQISAVTEEDAQVSMTRDERLEIGRRTVLDVVCDACDGAPGLKSDWFAVSPER